MSILRHFEEKGFSLEHNIRMRMQSAQGPAFEEAVLLSCTKLFREGTRVDNVFRFYGETPEWACQKATIVARSSTGEIPSTFDIPNGSPVTPSTSVAYSAHRPKDVAYWIKSMHAGWCVPSILMGPDLMAWLRLENGRMLLVIFQAKCRTTGNILTMDADVTADAIRSLIPGRFFSTFFCKYNSFTFCPLSLPPFTEKCIRQEGD